jgi:5-methylcytosine-specific restriction endonuclease McrA
MPKRYRAWCSEECRIDKMVRAGWHVRFHVWERDEGVCAKCRADAGYTERVIWHLARARGFRFDGESYFPPDRESALRIREAWGRWRNWSETTSLWEADHVVPVAEGGGGCGLEGYRTLCRPCHREETAALRRRLSRARTA